MKRIYKYRIPAIDKSTLELPIGADVLSIQMQHGKLQLWALVDPDVEKEKRTFKVVTTGHPFDIKGKYKYIDTLQLSDGDLIIHFFEELEERKPI